MTAPAILLFAAGLGTRMGALTRTRPKPLIRVAGKALIDHALEIAREASPRRIAVNLHYLPAMIEAHLAGQDIVFCPEDGQLLDTGGGLRNALTALGPGPVLTLNTDAVWRGANPILQLLEAWSPDRSEALLSLAPPERALGHPGAGDFTLGPDGRLTRGGPMIYTGAQIIRPDVLHAIPDPVFSLNRVWDLLAQRGTLHGQQFSGHWCDVGRPESIAVAEAMLNQS